MLLCKRGPRMKLAGVVQSACIYITLHCAANNSLAARRSNKWAVSRHTALVSGWPLMFSIRA